jgi:hypothetical protein
VALPGLDEQQHCPNEARFLANILIYRLRRFKIYCWLSYARAEPPTLPFAFVGYVPGITDMEE